MDKAAVDTVAEKMTQAKVGDGLLNAASKSIISKKELDKQGEEVVVNIDDIDDNNFNHYSIKEEEIQDLILSIKMIGLQDPPALLKNPPGSAKGYRLTAGHKRMIAIRRMRVANEWGDTVKAKLNDLNAINLDVSDKAKEKLLIRDSNSKRRVYTDDDMINEAKDLDEFYAELRAASIEELEMADGSKIQIKGVKSRTLIAESMNVSPSQIEKVSRIEKKAVPEVREAIKEGKLNINTAAEVVDLTKEKQKKLLENHKKEKPKEKISTSDINTFKKKQKDENVTISVNKIRKDLAEIKELYSQKQDIEVTKKDLQAYERAITQIKKILEK